MGKLKQENRNNVDKGIFKRKLLKTYNIIVWRAVREVYTSKYTAIREILRTYDTGHRVGLGDDGVWDLCAHVVGLGRSEYLNSCYNPEELIHRAHRRDYVENFGYWIPNDENYKVPNSLDFIDKEV